MQLIRDIAPSFEGSRISLFGVERGVETKKYGSQTPVRCLSWFGHNGEEYMNGIEKTKVRTDFRVVVQARGMPLIP